MDKYFIALVPDEEEDMEKLIKERFAADKIDWPTKVRSENSVM